MDIYSSSPPSPQISDVKDLLGRSASSVAPTRGSGRGRGREPREGPAEAGLRLTPPTPAAAAAAVVGRGGRGDEPWSWPRGCTALL